MRARFVGLAIASCLFLACGAPTEIQTVVVTATPVATSDADATIAAAVQATVEAIPTATTPPTSTRIPCAYSYSNCDTDPNRDTGQYSGPHFHAGTYEYSYTNSET